MDPVWLAQSYLRRRKYDACLELCTENLEKNPYDQAVWYIKCRALTLKDWIDDTEVEEDGIAEVLLDENATAQMPRPGTSLSKPMTGAAGGGPSQSVRPMTNGGRPLTGFARPGTGGSGRSGGVEGAFAGARPGTSRPVTSSGRFVRLGTASMLSHAGGPFVNLDAMDLRKYAARPALARALCDYILYHEHNPKKAVELAALATVVADFNDWWWKARLGKGYYQLGLYRDAEKQFKSSIKSCNIASTSLELAKVYLKLDQPNSALDVYSKASEVHPGEVSFLLGQARVVDALNDMTRGVALYKRVLQLDSSNVEAIACLASFHFYSDQPEIALRYYRRLLQMGINNAELWNNLGVCCFHASQYDMTLNCFEHALAQADDESMADVWYNIGHLAIGIGDVGLAYQAFKVAISVNGDHAESLTNLGVLECRKGNFDAASSAYQTAARVAPHLFEPLYNNAVLANKLGDSQQAFELVTRALKVFPCHADSLDLLKQLKQQFTSL